MDKLVLDLCAWLMNTLLSKPLNAYSALYNSPSIIKN